MLTIIILKVPSQETCAVKHSNGVEYPGSNMLLFEF